MKRFKNATIFLEDEGFVRAGFAVENGVFREIRKGEGPEDGIDLQGQYVIPGLIGYEPASRSFITEAWESGPAAIIPAYTESDLLQKAGSPE